MEKTEQLESFESVKYRIKAEGMDYCFKHYSDFDEIKDKEFHKLRKAYIRSSENIEEYVNCKIQELQNEDGE